MILALDPGKNLGLALVNEKGVLLQHSIISLEDLETYELPQAKIIIGDGTGHDVVQEVLKERAFSFEIIDETNTSLEARKLYFKDHPPKGLLRLLPVGLRHPPELIDDYAAFAIALRYLSKTI